MTDAPFLVKDALGKGTSYLREHGCEQPRLDAELLIAHVLHVDRVHVYMELDRPLTDAEQQELRELLVRRSRGEPTAYLRGVREFYGRDFIVNSAVLIPRPETETLVDVVLREAASFSSAAGGPVRLLDAGTGSGCIALTLALECPDLAVTALDVSADALSVARANAEQYGIAERVEFSEGSWVSALGGGEQWDIIVSNPPYISSREWHELQQDVREFEPDLALIGGEDGLVPYRELVAGARTALREQGLLAFEIDPRNFDDVAAIVLEAFPHAIIGSAVDLTDRKRVLTASCVTLQ